ncbi:response regulator [soil metagenome]
MKPKILCIDDEPNILAGFQVNLRKDFEVLTAESGQRGLEIFSATPDLEVIVSDMRMPKMNGAAVLAQARATRPMITRVLLTGQTDIASAVSAINDGQIFRFLTKPCERDMLIAALRSASDHHRLITSEQVLLRDTLRGAIAALVDIMSITNPQAFGRSNRVKTRARELAEALELEEPWNVEIATALQFVGYALLPPETLDRLQHSQPLSELEHKQIARLPAVTEQVLAHIPRLEPIRAILAAVSRDGARPRWEDADKAHRAAEVVRVANDSDLLEIAGVRDDQTVEAMRGSRKYSEPVLAALATLSGTRARTKILEVPLSKLRPRMILAEDVRMSTGALLVPHGYEITVSFLERVRNFVQGAVKEPLRVLVPSDDL